jgi:uncharacterized protein (TIGR00725 family)
LTAAGAPLYPREMATPPQRPRDVIESAIFSLWDVVDDLARLYPPATDEYRVAIFGSARVRPGHPAYEQVKELARRLAARGCVIVTGGGPGLMQAANEGERLGDPENRRPTLGVRVALPFEQGANPFVEEAVTHGTFFSRLHHFARLSHAVVVVEGGIGTTLEALMMWQLLQVHHLDHVALVFLGPMWRALVEWAREHMLTASPPLAGAADLEIPRCVATIDEAEAVVAAHLEAFRAGSEAAQSAAGT